MKTFAEAIRTLKHLPGSNPEIVEEVLLLRDEFFSNGDAHDFVEMLTGIIRKGGSGKGWTKPIIRQLVVSAFMAGLIVGREMEKAGETSETAYKM